MATDNAEPSTTEEEPPRPSWLLVIFSLVNMALGVALNAVGLVGVEPFQRNYQELAGGQMKLKEISSRESVPVPGTTRGLLKDKHDVTKGFGVMVYDADSGTTYYHEFNARKE
ncbi:hypothetical protein [Blastopirellula marina]|uniref:Uncharacterized protein n=1 Tax=Blastopirellula marina TaxID=124 RepID=A0A2S8GLA9_9BACT|nr:hypothetical protein [Blastopirellula marina]PQO45223.1 hypothetical protein C5Y93_14770 [Blastopirellula marina]